MPFQNFSSNINWKITFTFILEHSGFWYFLNPVMSLMIKSKYLIVQSNLQFVHVCQSWKCETLMRFLGSDNIVSGCWTKWCKGKDEIELRKKYDMKYVTLVHNSTIDDIYWFLGTGVVLKLDIIKNWHACQFLTLKINIHIYIHELHFNMYTYLHTWVLFSKRDILYVYYSNLQILQDWFR